MPTQQKKRGRPKKATSKTSIRLKKVMMERDQARKKLQAVQKKLTKSKKDASKQLDRLKKQLAKKAPAKRTVGKTVVKPRGRPKKSTTAKRATRRTKAVTTMTASKKRKPGRPRKIQ